MAGDIDLFRRSIALRRVDAELVTGLMRDDFHHFELAIAHRAQVVDDVLAKTVRAPWTTCPGAATALQRLVGAALIERASDVGRLIDMRAQCTHMFDLAGLLLAFARRGEASLDYDAFVEQIDEAFDARLERDGAPVLRWTGSGNRVASDPPVSLGRGFRAWTEAMAVQPAEHAFVLRRAVFVAGGRREALDEHATADELGLPVGVCYSLGSDVRQRARRTIGTRVDYAAQIAADTVRNSSPRPR